MESSTPMVMATTMLGVYHLSTLE
jgi:hypothetical protein